MTLNRQDSPSTPRKLAVEHIKIISEAPAASRGKTKMLQWLDTGKIGRSDAILAKCFDCMGYYIDGRVDCGILSCPLYPFMPYRSKKRGVQGKSPNAGSVPLAEPRRL